MAQRRFKSFNKEYSIRIKGAQKLLSSLRKSWRARCSAKCAFLLERTGPPLFQFTNILMISNDGGDTRGRAWFKESKQCIVFAQITNRGAYARSMAGTVYSFRTIWHSTCLRIRQILMLGVEVSVWTAAVPTSREHDDTLACQQINREPHTASRPTF